MDVTVRGRPRRYSFPPLAGFSHPAIGHLAASLDELSARHFDLVRGIPDETFRTVPPGYPRSMSMVTAHMAAAELFWIHALSRQAGSPELADVLGVAVADPDAALAADRLEEITRTVRADVTVPCLRAVTGLDTPVPVVGGSVESVTPLGVLMHLIWHWTYHNGQCGLLAMQAGVDYCWTFERTLGVPG